MAPSAMIAGVVLEHVVRAAHVRVHRLLGQVCEGARQRCGSSSARPPNGDDRVVVSSDEPVGTMK